MLRALYTAATGMSAQQMNVDVIANNLSNVNTTGFKKMRVDFEDLFYQTYQVPGTKTSATTVNTSGIQVGLGTRPVDIQKGFSQGEFQETDNPLDLAIEGDGFFQVALPDGTSAYTRAGAFKKDGEGRLVTSDGYLMQPEITIPQDASEIYVGVDGTVSVRQSGVTESSIVGNIELARFVNPAGLSNLGKSLYYPTESSGEALTGTPGTGGFGGVAQRYLESSNVKVVEEMVNMIMAQRAYEVNSKVIKTSDDMIGMANNLTR